MLENPQDEAHIVYGNSFSEDRDAGTTVDYLLAA